MQRKIEKKSLVSEIIVSELVALNFLYFSHVSFEETCITGFYRHLSTHLFWRRLFGKYIGYEGHLFFENVQNSM